MERIKRFFGIALLLFLVIASVVEEADAQKRRRSRRRGPKGGGLECAKNLPEFFVDDNVLPNYLKKVYKRDATRIALRLINKEQRLSKQRIQVPQHLVKAVYNALVAVRVSDYGAIDTIARIYNVRTFPVPNVSSLTLIAEHDAAWMKPLKKRADTTGSYQLNRLIRKHNLVMTKVVYLDEERAGLVLRSRAPINMPALSRHFFMSLGIGTIEETLPFGDGNDIAVTRADDGGWDIEYSVRFGNCLEQCKKHHEWYFHVTKGGKVEFNGSGGHVVPPWIAKKTRTRYPDRLKSK